MTGSRWSCGREPKRFYLAAFTWSEGTTQLSTPACGCERPHPQIEWEGDRRTDDCQNAPNALQTRYSSTGREIRTVKVIRVWKEGWNSENTKTERRILLWTIRLASPNSKCVQFVPKVQLVIFFWRSEWYIGRAKDDYWTNHSANSVEEKDCKFFTRICETYLWNLSIQPGFPALKRLGPHPTTTWVSGKGFLLIYSLPYPSLAWKIRWILAYIVIKRLYSSCFHKHPTWVIHYWKQSATGTCRLYFVMLDFYRSLIYTRNGIMAEILFTQLLLTTHLWHSQCFFYKHEFENIFFSSIWFVLHVLFYIFLAQNKRQIIIYYF